ncbi:MAG: protein kinase, partial [Actinomycetota bacterium]|nr:protein kinase [Actinomycetota bacterium]
DHVYVSDFGLTKRALSVSGLTATGQLVGTIDYVAPEHIKGDQVDGRADVYSLGCVIVECLTGHVPYPRDLEVAVLWAHVEDAPPSVTDERPDLPPEVDDVVASAMAKDPNARTATAGAVAAGLRSALRIETPTAEQTRPRERPVRPPRRRVSLVAALVALAAVLAVGVAIFLAGGGGDEGIVPPANSVARIDVSGTAFATPLRVGEDPTGVAVGEDGDLWVINQGDSTVNRIDPGTGEVSSAKSTLGIPTGIAAGQGAVWITNGFGSQSGTQVLRVDPANDSVEVAFPSDNAKAIVVAIGSIWLADADRDRVLRYDPSSPSAEPVVIPVDDGQVADAAPGSLSLGSGAAAGIWVANELGDSVIRINPETNEVADRIQVQAPTAVAADDSGVWVTSEANDRVHHFDPVEGRALRTFEHADGIPDGPTAIVIAPSGVWIGSDLESAVARIDPETNAVDRLALGGITGGMTVDGNGDVWVAVRAQQA